MPHTAMLELNDVRTAVAQVLHPENFLAQARFVVVGRHAPARTLAWEILGGHLLDERQTREVKRFEAWDVALKPAAGGEQQPLVSILLAEEESVCYVIRHLLVHGFEAYEDAPGVILSREVQRWTRELVGTVRLAEVMDAQELPAKLSRLVLLALIGTSRLPVTSLETPLPAFLLGRVAYVGQACSLPGRLQACPTLVRAKALEAELRATEKEDVPGVAKRLVSDHSAAEVSSLLRTLFNHAALTPYTRFGENFVQLLRQLAEPDLLGVRPTIDVVSYVLRHLVRHLTAFDLQTFHNRGADYPDLLLLDALLRVYCEWIEQHAEEFRGTRRRRRALRQAWFIRKHYEGLKVPEVPTSPGDHVRVLPEEFPRVTEEEILQPHKRGTELFAGDAIDERLSAKAKELLKKSLSDLDYDTELRELGMAVYLDRPLGIAKRPGEVDRTPLLSYEAFSRTVAQRRLEEMRRWGMLEQEKHDALADRVRALPVVGFSLTESDGPPRPGMPCLEDANLTVGDFLFLRTTRSALAEFLGEFDVQPLAERFPEIVSWLDCGKNVLLIRCQSGPPEPGEPLLVALDEQMNARLELAFAGDCDRSVAYVESVGREWPVGGLRVVRAGDKQRTEDVRGEDVRLLPK